MFDTSDRGYGPLGTCDEFIICNLYNSDDDLLVSITEQQEKQQMRMGWITHKPKHPLKKPHLHRISINTRNRLHCKRKIKQSIRGLKND